LDDLTEILKIHQKKLRKDESSDRVVSHLAEPEKPKALKKPKVLKTKRAKRTARKTATKV
jgi:hypothetical protein